MSVAETLNDEALAETMTAMGQAARRAMATLGQASRAVKDRALRAQAAAIRARATDILEANAQDMTDARAAGLSAAMLDRLLLNAERIEGMAAGIEAIAALSDPVGEEFASWTQPNGLRIARVRVPLGVIAVIYESRPNVTADAGALCLKSGNAAILRCGSESFRSSGAIHACLTAGLAEAGLPETAIQRVPTRDRTAVGLMFQMPEHIDIIVPRGGKGLIERVQRESRVPVIAHLDGNCHVYVDGAASLDTARAISLNAKMRRTGICGASETLLVDRAVAASHLPLLVRDLLDAGCEVRGDAAARAVDDRVVPVEARDWDTEYLDKIIAVGLVDGVEGALAHIDHYGSHHTDCIVTEDGAAAERFLGAVDSAIVLLNASTQFADGGEFGMGAEIGISTNRLHARGPVGVEQLTSYKYVVRGDGQTRP